MKDTYFGDLTGVGPVVEQKGDRLRAALFGCDVQGRAPLPIADPQHTLLVWFFEEGLQNAHVALLARQVQRCRPARLQRMDGQDFARGRLLLF